uniref:Putative regulatory protein FmdB zinc ribbon domain-containing protein n=1 Tax=viral metagenome TaxID=1070528 RepID=A0A6M3L004_9ZZZZ
MPIYVYECDSCTHKFEEKQAFKDDPLTICPECGGEIHRVIFAPNVHYKSAGFYTTEQRGLTGRKRKPKIKVGLTSDLPPEEREKHLG